MSRPVLFVDIACVLNCSCIQLRSQVFNSVVKTIFAPLRLCAFALNCRLSLLSLMSLLSLLSFTSLTANEPSPPIQPGRMLYLIQAGRPKEAVSLYQAEYAVAKRHNFELLQKVGLGILEEGAQSKDPESQLMTLFGAAISANEQAFHILDEGTKNKNPQLQVVALNLLAQNQSDAVEEALVHAVASWLLPIRLEAVYYLAQRKHPLAVSQAECLMVKMPKEIQPLFPQIFALVGNDQAMKVLRKLFASPSDPLRIATIISCAKQGRDDMLPHIRRASNHFNVGQQEACAYALGLMRDEASAEKLEKMTRSRSPAVSLAAYQALYRLGRLETRQQVEKMALQEDLFAIGVLANMPGSEDILARLVSNPNVHVRLNAALALLERSDPRCLPGLMEMLIRDARDIAFVQSESQGHAFTSWKVVPSATQNLKETPMTYELSIGLRERVLVKARTLREGDFLSVADQLLDRQQGDLVPVLVRLLQDLNTTGALDLLKKHQQKLGAPLIRHYCNLALYRMKVPGPYADNLRAWVKEQNHVELISFRPLVPWKMRSDAGHYQLTPKETSRLLVEAFEAFASQQDEAGIEALVDAILNGNQKNKYALAGLLIRATQ